MGALNATPPLKDWAQVEAFFVSRASAVERIVLARRALVREMEGGGAGAFTLSQGPSLLDKLEQLLFDVRAGRNRISRCRR